MRPYKQQWNTSVTDWNQQRLLPCVEFNHHAWFVSPVHNLSVAHATSQGARWSEVRPSAVSSLSSHFVNSCKRYQKASDECVKDNSDVIQRSVCLRCSRDECDAVICCTGPSASSSWLLHVCFTKLQPASAEPSGQAENWSRKFGPITQTAPALCTELEETGGAEDAGRRGGSQFQLLVKLKRQESMMFQQEDPGAARGALFENADQFWRVERHQRRRRCRRRVAQFPPRFLHSATERRADRQERPPASQRAATPAATPVSVLQQTRR